LPAIAGGTGLFGQPAEYNEKIFAQEVTGIGKFPMENLVTLFLHELCTRLSTNIVEKPKSFSAQRRYATLLRQFVNDRLLKIHCPIKVTANF